MAAANTSIQSSMMQQHGPSRIFIVRHGDRIDHENPVWRSTAPRPHDSPLSKRGHQSAHLLGRYLANHCNVRITPETKVSDIVVLASPLQRTVETGHGIIYGIIAASGAGHLMAELQHAAGSKGAVASERYAEAAAAVDALVATNEKFKPQHQPSSSSLTPQLLTPVTKGGEYAGQEPAETANQRSMPSLQAGSDLPFIPIYLEPGVIEGEYWQNQDIAHGVSMGNAKVRIEAVGTGSRYKELLADVDHGVYRGANFHKEHISPLVQVSSLRCPRRSAEGDSAYSMGFGDVWFEYDKKSNQMIEHGDGVQVRCQKTIKNISESPALDGKIVIIVGHGETTWELVKGLCPFAKGRQPVYTSFTECVRMSDEELKFIEEAKAANAASPAPTRSKLQVLGNKVRMPNGDLVAEWQRWKVAEGTLACDAPHLREYHAV